MCFKNLAQSRRSTFCTLLKISRLQDNWALSFLVYLHIFAETRRVERCQLRRNLFNI